MRLPLKLVLAAVILGGGLVPVGLDRAHAQTQADAAFSGFPIAAVYQRGASSIQDAVTKGFTEISTLRIPSRSRLTSALNRSLAAVETASVAAIDELNEVLAAERIRLLQLGASFAEVDRVLAEYERDLPAALATLRDQGKTDLRGLIRNGRRVSTTISGLTGRYQVTVTNTDGVSKDIGTVFLQSSRKLNGQLQSTLLFATTDSRGIRGARWFYRGGTLVISGVAGRGETRVVPGQTEFSITGLDFFRTVPAFSVVSGIVVQSIDAPFGTDDTTLTFTFRKVIPAVQ